MFFFLYVITIGVGLFRLGQLFLNPGFFRGFQFEQVICSFTAYEALKVVGIGKLLKQYLFFRN